MKPTLIVLFVLAMIVSSTQTFRHVYVKYFEPTSSVLDDFQSVTESNIENADSLDELVDLYAIEHKKIEKYESDAKNPLIESNNRRNVSPYKEHDQILKEIRNREHDQRQLSKLWFFWVCGLISLALGLISFRFINRWLGFAAIVTGFSEMLVWTSPLFHNRLLSSQFEHLLDHKLLLSIVTWVILILVWLLIEKRSLLGHDS